MNNFILSLHAVLPMFLIMAVGYLIRYLGLMNRKDVFSINKICFKVFLPCMLYHNIYTSDLSGSIRPSLMAFAVVSVLIIYLLATLYVVRSESDPSLQGVMIQGLFRSNYVIMGLPIAEALLGTDQLGPISILIGIVVPIYNVLAVICLERYRGNKKSIRDLFFPILKNPLIIGSFLGIMTLILRIRLPYVIDSAVSGLAQVAAPLQLFTLGVFFEFSGLRKFAKQLIKVNTGKLVIVPGIFLTIAYYLGFRNADFVSLMGIFAAPTAISSFTMAQQMGGNDELAGDIVVSTTAFSCLSMFLWVFLFKTIGAF